MTKSSSKAAYRKQVLEHLAAIRAAVEAEGLRTLQMEKLIAAFEKQAEAVMQLANALAISNSVKPTSEWNRPVPDDRVDLIDLKYWGHLVPDPHPNP